MRIGTGKSGMGETLVREENDSGEVWSDAVDKHRDARRDQTSTVLKGKTRRRWLSSGWSSLCCDGTWQSLGTWIGM